VVTMEEMGMRGWEDVGGAWVGAEGEE